MKELRRIGARALLLLLLVLPMNVYAQHVAAYRDLARYFTDNLYAIGIVGTVYENGEFHDFTAGARDLPTKTAIDEDTYFELGSATKAFTGTLFARELVLGHLRLEQTVAEFLPELAGTPGGAITLKELATHTSGLPRMPGNLVDNGADINPTLNYTVAMLNEYLKTVQITDKTYEYSNTGIAVLAEILSIVNGGMSYGDMLREFIQKPLGIDVLATQWSEEIERKLSKKYNSILRPEPYWTDLNALNPTGIIKTNLRSMKAFILAQLHPESLSSPLREAILLSQQVHAEAPEFKMGLGWFIDTIKGINYVNHNGSTEGFTIEFLLDTNAKRAIFYVSNTDLVSPGLCLTKVFTGDECEKPVAVPIANVAPYLGKYLAQDQPQPFSFQILQDERYGFLYILEDEDIQQRLFLRRDGALVADSDTIVVKFQNRDKGSITDTWGEVEEVPFARVTTPPPLAAQ